MSPPLFINLGRPKTTLDHCKKGEREKVSLERRPLNSQGVERPPKVKNQGSPSAPSSRTPCKVGNVR